MRVIQMYEFHIGTKIPYSDFPSIVHSFLDDQKLTFQKFLYYFDELLYSQKSYEEAIVTGSCAKAVKDCPALGKMHFFNGDDYGMYQKLFLSNIDIATDCTEADILPYMNKIYRRYGFGESNLYYYDIDFFNKIIPYDRDMSSAKSRAEHFKREVDTGMFLETQPYGSGICLHRDLVDGSCISMSIDVLHNGEFYDATPYCDAMKALLPNIKPAVGMKIYLNDEEKQEIARWDEQIAPVLEKARNFFAERFPSKERQNRDSSKYNIAPKLKKLAKQYGYYYLYLGYGAYLLEKITARGHVLQIFVDSGPSHFDTTYSMNMQGIGFRHRICTSRQTPTNQAESEACSEKFFSAISEFEKTFVPELDAFYEETPEWFISLANYCG